MNNKRITIGMICVLASAIAVLITSVSSILIFVVNSRKECEKNVYDQIEVVLNGRTSTIREYISKSELLMKQYGYAPSVKEVLLHPEDEALVQTAQEYTSKYYAQMEGWEGIYTSNWDTVVQVHSTPQVVGMQTRSGDDLPPYRATMTNNPDNFFNGGAFISPASGQMILNLRMAILDDNGEPIGLVGGGPFLTSLSDSLAEVTNENLSEAKFSLIDYNQNVFVISSDEKFNSCDAVEDETLLSVIGKVKDEGVMDGDDIVKIDNAKHIISYKTIPEFNLVLVMTCPTRGIYSSITSTNVKVSIILALEFIILVAVTFVFGRFLNGRFKNIIGDIEQVSGGNINAEITSDNFIAEIYDISLAIHKLQAQVGSVLEEVNNTANEVLDKSNRMTDTINLCKKSTDMISDAISNVAEGATDIADNTERSVNAIDNIDSQIQNISVNVNACTDICNEVRGDIDESNRKFNQLSEVSEKAIETSKGVLEQANRISEIIVKIEDAAKVITDIAGQTNLLSLNASIEAARVGEAGRGFAVVADEIKQLADQSDRYAKEIQNVVNDIKAATEVNGESAKQIKEAVEVEKDVIEGVVKGFAVLVDRINEVVQKVSVVDHATDQLQNSSQEIVEALQSLSAVSEENAAISQETSSTVDGVQDKMDNIKDDADDLTRHTDRLAEVMTYFKI